MLLLYLPCGVTGERDAVGIRVELGLADRAAKCKDRDFFVDALLSLRTIVSRCIIAGPVRAIFRVEHYSRNSLRYFALPRF